MSIAMRQSMENPKMMSRLLERIQVRAFNFAICLHC